MAQFIIVTDARTTEHRLNVAHIAAYSGTATDKGCEATIKLTNEITIDVKENVEAIDRLIRNIDKRSVLSGGPRSPFGWINPRHKKSSGRRSAVGNIRHGGTHLGRVGGGLAGPEQCAP